MANRKKQAIGRFDSPEQEGYLRIWRLHERLNMLENEVFKSQGISAQQYNTLRLLLGRHPEPMQTLQIARKLISHAPDITRLLDGLDKKGLITRSRSLSSRRVVEVGITEAGIRLIEEMDPALQELHQRQLGHLDKNQLEELNELLRLAGAPHEPPDSSWK